MRFMQMKTLRSEPEVAETHAMCRQMTVVIPCYNAADWVARTIGSVRAQGEVVGRIIVVDDGSTDTSLDVLHPLAEAGEITLITGPNKGGCHARNVGLAEVDTPYVMFLDADDEIAGDILQGSVGAAQAYRADVVFSAMEIRYPEGRSILHAPVGPPQQSAREVFENWFDGGWIGCCSVVWRTDFVRGIGGWDETLRVGQDGDLVLRALLADARVARNEKGLGIYYRDNPGSVSMSGGVTRSKLEGQIDTIVRLSKAARDKGWGNNLGRNYAALYYLARKSFGAGYTDLGRRALGLLRELGSHGHYGTRAHNAVAGLIGLERKVRWFGS